MMNLPWKHFYIRVDNNSAWIDYEINANHQNNINPRQLFIIIYINT